MKTLKINLPYGLKNEEKSQQSTYNIILQGVSSKYPNGLDGEYRRSFARVQRKLDEAIDNNLDEINLEEAEFNLIKNSIQDGKFSAVISKYVSILEEEVERASKEVKPEPAPEG